MKIYRIGELETSAAQSAGGKARGLDFLKRHGYKIAEGFIVTEIENFGEEEYTQILNAFDKLNTESVSVRSSASDEDGREHSNAGQYDTCLCVTRKELKEAVEKCLRSLSGERATAYSKTFLAGKRASMNLVIERMIDASYAGVMFSSDPMKRENVLIEAVQGAGEQLVGGEKSAWQYSIPKGGFSFESPYGISEEALKQIYTEGLQIQKEFGAEVDLEWLIDQAGQLFWLQLRPITTMDTCDLDEFDPPHSLENHLLTSRNIGEMMPGAVTPLSISTSVLAIDYGMRNMLSRIGAIKKINSKPDFYAAMSVKYHLFIDMSALYIMSNRVMLASNESMNLSIMGQYFPDYPKPEGKNACGLTKFVNGIRFAKYLFSSKKAKKKIVSLCDNLKFEALEEREIYSEIDKKMPVLMQALCCHYVCSSFSGAMNSALYMMLADTFKEKSEYQSFLSALLSDIDGIESADILHSLKALASEILLLNPDAKNFTEAELLAFVEDERNAEVNRLYREFLIKHGHRSIKEAEMRSKPWRKDPVSLMKNLRAVMLAGEVEDAPKQPFDMQKLLENFKRKQKKALGWIGKNARRAVVDREFSKSYIIRVIDKFRDRYALLGELLAKKGLLSDEDCIYFLSHDEIGKLLCGDTSLKRKAVMRRVIFGEAEEMSFPDICIGMPQPIQAEQSENETTLHGNCVCRGKVYGRARIVKNFEDAQKLEKGEIMIAPFTDIGWSPFYSVISALITEVGSTLSHGAVVAREFCLPTIVNVKMATKIIHDGDYLCVDASRGTVTILSEEDLKRSA